MEKQNKSVSLGGKKRQRKISLPGNASESKHIKLDLSDNITRLKHSVSLEKKTKHVKPKKGEINNLPEAIAKIKTNPKPTSKAKPKANLESVGAKIESVQPKDEAAASKQKEKLSANNDQNSLKSKIKSVLTALPKKKNRKPKLKVPKETDLKKETLEASNKADNDEPLETDEDAQDTANDTNKEKQSVEKVSLEEIREKFPILKNQEIIEKFLKVPLSNNQKGRIRQAIKLSLQGTSQTMFPDIINGKIQAILNSSADLTDSELRRIRILFNMLKTAVESPSELEEKKSPKKKTEKKKREKGEDKEEGKEKREERVKKVKGPKRYVVFLGNLPLNVNKEKIMDHFKELNEHIKDIRLPKLAEGTKSAIAFVELSNEPSYELALSKHHSMMGSKRIKVLYTTQQNSKISKSEAKGKSAKLIALQKSGKLVGSIPMSKKRSHRRAIMKKAKAVEAAANA